jgi:predicted amino acid racemase
MSYPILDINLKTIEKNVRTVNSLCKEHSIDITGVTKVFSGEPLIVKSYIAGGLKRVGDARIENLRKLKELDIEKWLIRVPSLSQVKEVIAYSDVSLNTEFETLLALNKEAKLQNKIHKVILLVDLGDLREGYTDSNELLKVANQIKELNNIILYGVGTNLTCFSFILPDEEKMNILKKIASDLPIKNPVVTGGNSATIKLMMEGGIPSEVNNLRLGECLLFGKERSTYTFLDHTQKDAFILSAEVVELKDKPSVPWGEVGFDSYGNLPQLPSDSGIVKRAIVAVGKQDCDIETMKPLDSSISILGASSDYLIVDITNSKDKYKVGSIIKFTLGYFSLMRAITSDYVSKNYF